MNATSKKIEGNLKTVSDTEEIIMILPVQAELTMKPSGITLTLQELTDWAIELGLDIPYAKSIVLDADKFAINPEILKSADYESTLATFAKEIENMVVAFKKQMDIEPVGFLHLERLTFAPDGIESR